MGSDLYMESRNFRPGPTKVYWKGNILYVEKDHFYDGYRVVWSGNPTGKEDVLKAFGVTVPKHPDAPVRKTRKIVEFVPSKSDTAGDLASFFGSVPARAKINYRVVNQMVGYGMGEHAEATLEKITATWTETK